MSLFKTLILIGRPASGKSEFIDFMKKTPDAERATRFHLGPITELDDFLWLWEKFTEDNLWEAAGHPRRYSKHDDHAYTITDYSILDYCLARFNTEFKKQPKTGTVFVEFARGAQDGGYAKALSKFSDEILKDAAILFIYASYEEACRRNDARYQEKLKHSVLAHKVPDEDMIRFGKDIDWLKITQDQPAGELAVRNFQVPFVTMNNEPELNDPALLGERYQQALNTLRRQS